MRDYFKKKKLIYVGAVAADSDLLIWPLWTVENAIKITAIRLGTNTAIVATDTDYQTLSIKNGTVVVATLATGPNATGVAIAAGALGNFTLVEAAGANEVAAGSVLKLSAVLAGSGMALVACSIEIDYYDYNA